MKKLSLLLSVLLAILLTACSPKTKPNAHNYFEIPLEDTGVYADAINVYNTFLNGNSKAVKNGTDTKISIDDFISSSSKNADQYVLFDLDADGSPELHFIGSTSAIFTIVDKQPVLVYTESPVFEFHQLLPIPGTMSTKRGNGVTYRFVTMGKDKTITTVEFTDPQSTAPNAKYTFEGEELSKTDWEVRTKPLFDYTKDAPIVPWETYTKHH